MASKKRKVLGYGCNDGEGALKTTEAPVLFESGSLGSSSGSLGSKGSSSRSLGSMGSSSAEAEPPFKIRDTTAIFFGSNHSAACKRNLEALELSSPSGPLPASPSAKCDVVRNLMGYPTSSSLPSLAQDATITMDDITASIAALVALANQVAARAGTLFERVPSLMRSLNTQASELQEQLAAETKAQLDSEAKLAEVLKKNQELQHALDYSLCKNMKLQEEFNAQVATLKEREAEREQAIFLSRGVAKAVRSSMESAGADMLDAEPDHRSPEEWARLTERYLKYLDDINKASNKSFAVASVMACAATVAVGLKDTGLDVAMACLQAGCPQNAFDAARAKQQALKTAAENFVYGIAKTIEAAKNQTIGESS